MSGYEYEEVIELINHRSAFLEYLIENTAHKPRIVDELEYSRSTVDRAIDSLTTHGLVVRTNSGFSTTSAAELALREYRKYIERSAAVLDAQDALAHLDDPSEIESAVLNGARIERAEGPASVSPVRRLEGYLQEATEISGLVSKLTNPHLLRILRTRAVEDELAIDLTVTPELLQELRAEFPHSAVEVATQPAATIHSGTLPESSVLIVHTGDTRAILVLIYQDTGISAVIENTTQEAIRWATETVDHYRGAARDHTDELSALEIDPEVPRLTASEASIRENDSLSAGRVDEILQMQLEQQGFVIVDDTLTDAASASDPSVAFRAGLDFSAISAGYAFHRETPDGESVVDHLVESLLDDGPLVVTGPPGSGKSTACRTVALEWYEREYGTVFYREYGRGQPFDSPTTLIDQIQRGDGHVLVVVEDATRREANQIFEVMDRLGDRTSVSFLLDSRADEWEDPPEFPRSARLSSVKSTVSSIEVISPLSDEEQTKFLDHVEEVTGRQLEAETREGLIESTTSTGESDDAAAVEGEVHMLYVSTRVAELIDPQIRTHAPTPTKLSEQIREVYDELVAVDSSVALDIGVGVNLLNAAGVEIHRDTIWALGNPAAESEIEAAIDVLEETVLFTEYEGMGYRTVHEIWSETFLDVALTEEPTRTVRQRVANNWRAIQSVVSDPSRRGWVQDVVTPSPFVEMIAADPTEVIESILTRLIEFGVSRSRFAPIFGSEDRATIDIPESVAPTVAYQCRRRRGDMFRQAGQLETAEAVYEQTVDTLETSELPTESRDRIEAACLRGLGNIEWTRGNQPDAREYLTAARNCSRAIDDTAGESRDLLNIGNSALGESELEQAETALEESIELAREAGDDETIGRALNSLGMVANRRGRYDHAHKRYQEALSYTRRVHDGRNEANILGNLGVNARDQGDFETAQRCFKQKLDVARNRGDARGEPNSLFNLGMVARRRGELKTATEYATDALEQYRTIGEQSAVGECLYLLGDIARRRGERSIAEEYFTRCLEAFRDSDARRGEAYGLRGKAKVHLENGEIAEAVTAAEESLSLCESMDASRGVAESYALLARAELERDNIANARSHNADALAGHRALERPTGIARARCLAARIELDQRDFDACEKELTDAHTALSDITAPYLRARIARIEARRCERQQLCCSAQKYAERAYAYYSDAGAYKAALDVIECALDNAESLYPVVRTAWEDRLAKSQLQVETVERRLNSSA